MQLPGGARRIPSKMPKWQVKADSVYSIVMRRRRKGSGLVEQNSSQNTVTLDIVRKAIMGAAIRNSGELLASYGGIPQECIAAAQVVGDNYAQFEDMVWKRLSGLAEIKHFFGRLIKTRLRQKGILASPIISVIFDDQPKLEERLSRVRSISGVDELRKEYRGTSHPDLGHITDEDIIDFSAEVLALDLLGELGFSNIIKVQEPDNRAHVDITAERDEKHYAVEVTRKREVRGWQTLPYGNLEDCEAAINQDRIRKVLLHALAKKDDQFSRAIDAGTIDSAVIKVLAIKTSDYGFVECINQAEKIARKLLNEEGNWLHVDCIWLMPDTSVRDSCWLCKNDTSVVFTSGRAA